MSGGARTAMSKAVTSGVAAVGPTPPAGVGGGSTRGGGGKAGAVCVTFEAGDATAVIDTAAGVLAWPVLAVEEVAGSVKGAVSCALAGKMQKLASATKKARVGARLARQVLKYVTGAVY